MITGVEEMDERTGDPPGERGIGFQIRHRWYTLRPMGKIIIVLFLYVWS